MQKTKPIRIRRHKKPAFLRPADSAAIARAILDCSAFLEDLGASCIGYQATVKGGVPHIHLRGIGGPVDKGETITAFLDQVKIRSDSRGYKLSW